VAAVVVVGVCGPPRQALLCAGASIGGPVSDTTEHVEVGEVVHVGVLASYIEMNYHIVLVPFFIVLFQVHVIKLL